MDTDGMIKFISTVFLLPVFAFSSLVLMRRMIDGDLPAAVGIGSIIAMFGLYVVSISTSSAIIAGALILLMVSMVVFYPFAEDMLSRQELQEMDLSRLERAFEAVHKQPDNVPARFQLAEKLYDFGLKLPAAVFAEQTLQGLSTVMDPMKNVSLRDHYRNEEVRARRWRAEADRTKMKPITCACGHRNPPALLSCEKCQRPHLLELIRQRRSVSNPGVKILISWIVISALIGGALFALPKLPDSIAMPVLAVAILVSGGVIANLFRVKKIA